MYMYLAFHFTIQSEFLFFYFRKFIMSNKDIRIKMYRSSIQKRVEELEVEKDDDDSIEKGWEIALNLYKAKSTEAMTKNG